MNMGWPGRLTLSYPPKSVTSSAMCLQWWKQQPDGWKTLLCHMPLPGTILDFKGKPYSDTYPGRIESNNRAHFWNNLIKTWAKERGIEWLYLIPYHAPASGKIEHYSVLLKTTLQIMGNGTFKHWDTHLAKATWLVSNRGSSGPCPVKISMYCRKG